METWWGALRRKRPALCVLGGRIAIERDEPLAGMGMLEPRGHGALLP